jgi:hypothetical protein
MKKVILFFAVLIVLSMLSGQTFAVSCFDYNKLHSRPDIWWGSNLNQNEHAAAPPNKGSHNIVWDGGYYCSYNKASDGISCIPHSQSVMSAESTEKGSDTSDSRVHHPPKMYKTEHQDGNEFGGDEPKSRVTMIWDVTSCLPSDIGCKDTSLSIDSSYHAHYVRNLGTSGHILIYNPYMGVAYGE